MYYFKLVVCYCNSADQNDLLLTSKDFVDVVIGDVLEIYHQDGDFR